MRYKVSIDYALAIFGCPKKLSEKKTGGCNSPFLGGRGLSVIPCDEGDQRELKGDKQWTPLLKFYYKSSKHQNLNGFFANTEGKLFG